MKHVQLLIASFFLMSIVAFSQDSSKIFELTGRIDVLGNITIDILPRNGKLYSPASIAEINSIIGKTNGNSVNVLSALSDIGFKFISAVYICSDHSNNFNGNFLIYYLSKSGKNID